eukprot:782651-Pelagomonas_calceolata.AAC.1
MPASAQQTFPPSGRTIPVECNLTVSSQVPLVAPSFRLDQCHVSRLPFTLGQLCISTPYLAYVQSVRV